MPKGKDEQIENIEEPALTAEEEETALETADAVSDNTLEEQNSEVDDMPITEPSGSGIDDTVSVQTVKFASFDDASKPQGELNKNLEILMDVKLQMTVELGRTELPIKKVLELTRGSIIELEKVAGEPVELYANGKLVAHGEVVVIEDNFGLRITSITEPEERLKGL